LGEFKGQGYFYGQPESAAETRKKLAALGLLNAKPQIPAPAAPESAGPQPRAATAG
jgi:hypothetical protein